MDFRNLLIVIFLSVLVGDCRGATSSSGPNSAWIRNSVVDGKFYPDDPQKLRAAVRTFLKHAAPVEDLQDPVAIVSPHAGYVFSGQIAGDAFAAVSNQAVDTVVILGTNHRAPGFHDFAVWPAGGFRTPLGVAAIDEALSRKLIADHETCVIHNAAHRQEHSVEVQVPFAQEVFPGAKLVAVVVATADPDKCRAFGEALADALDGRRALIVASSDLSHYPNYEDAKHVDLRVLDAIATMDPKQVHRTIAEMESSPTANLATCACGQGPILAAMAAAKKMGAHHAIRVSYANSGDVAVGDVNRVVGYGAMIFARGGATVVEPKGESQSTELDRETRIRLLRLARDTIARYLESETVPLVRGFDGVAMEHRGAFVTLKKNKQLRGCIGHMAEDTPLCKCVSSMALQAAFGDRRFDPVKADELEAIDIEISVLTPMTRVSGPQEFVVGRDGIRIRKRGRSAVFLPQVAPEQGWTREETLDHLCRKAGLAKDSWRSDTEFYTFQAEVFGDRDMGLTP